MKKSILIINVVIFSLLLINLLTSISIVYAQEDSLPPEIQKIQDIGEKISDKQTRAEYLKQEWGKILEEKFPFFKFFIKGIRTTAPFFNPVFEALLGMPPSFSWFFGLTLVLYIALLIYIYRIMEITNIWSKWTFNLMFLGVAVVITVMRITQTLSNYLIKAVAILQTTQAIAAVVAIILALILASIFSKNVRNLIKHTREEAKKTKREQRAKELKTKVEAIEKGFG